MFLAHVKWFVEDTYINEAPLTNGEIMFVVAFVCFGLLLLKIIDSYIKKQKAVAKFSDKIQPLREWVPTSARVVLGIMLLHASASNYVFVPNLHSGSSTTDVLVLFSSLVGMMFILGLGTRISAVILSAIYLVGIFSFGLGSMLDHIEILGLGIYLFIEGGGRLALDNVFGMTSKMSLKYRKHSLRILLISAGLSFSILAFSEKLGDISLAMRFLSDHNWNFLSLVGATDRQFVIFIGASELIIGLSLILGLASRFVVILLLGLLATTAILLGVSEVVGHAFAVCVVLAAWLIHDLPLMRSKLK